MLSAYMQGMTTAGAITLRKAQYRSLWVRRGRIRTMFVFPLSLRSIAATDADAPHTYLIRHNTNQSCYNRPQRTVLLHFALYDAVVWKTLA